MRILVQRVENASIAVDGKLFSERKGKGLLIYFGAKKNDSCQSAKWLAQKTVNLRIFEDENNKMNLSVKDINGFIAIVSEFTLYGNCQKGKRPSFDLCESPDKAESLYNAFVEEIRKLHENVITGKFRSYMKITATNDGPVTFIIEHPKN